MVAGQKDYEGWTQNAFWLCFCVLSSISLSKTNTQTTTWTRRRINGRDDGFLATVASDIVGPWLGTWTVMAAAVSNIGLYQAELSADSLQLAGMARRGYLPQVLGTTSSRGTPTYGILIGTIVILLFITVSELDSLIEMLNVNYGLSLLLEYAAFLRLRYKNQELARPFRVPCGMMGCCLLVSLPMLGTGLVLFLASWQTILVSIAVNFGGIALYVCFHGSRNDYSSVEPSEKATELTTSSTMLSDHEV